MIISLKKNIVRICKVLSLIAVMLSSGAYAQPASLPSSPSQVQRLENPESVRAQSLYQQLRCMVCAGESIAGSDATLASNMRNQVAQMIESGASDNDILQYFVERYGEAVLMNPPMRLATWLLWFGPAILLVVAVLLLARGLVKSGKG